MLGVETEQTAGMIGKEFPDSEILAVTSSFKKCQKRERRGGGGVTGEKATAAMLRESVAWKRHQARASQESAQGFSSLTER